MSWHCFRQRGRLGKVSKPRYDLLKVVLNISCNKVWSISKSPLERTLQILNNLPNDSLDLVAEKLSDYQHLDALVFGSFDVSVVEGSSYFA